MSTVIGDDFDNMQVLWMRQRRRRHLGELDTLLKKTWLEQAKKPRATVQRKDLNPRMILYFPCDTVRDTEDQAVRYIL
jgi:hypothetical protein